MKFPTKSWNGVRPTGTDKVRALDRLGIPFSSSGDIGSVRGEKMGQFAQTFGGAEYPYLWGRFRTSDMFTTHYLPMAYGDPQKAQSTRTFAYDKSYTVSLDYNGMQPHAPYIGDGYVAQLAVEDEDWGPTFGQVMWWSLVRPLDYGKNFETLPTFDPKDKRNRSVSYIAYGPDEMPLSGQAMTTSIVPTGWDTETGRYSYCTVMQGGSDLTTSPFYDGSSDPAAVYFPKVAFVAGTDLAEPAIVQLPIFPDTGAAPKTPYAAPTFCIAPGALQTLRVSRGLETGTGLEQIHIVRSTDHGATWTMTASAELEALRPTVDYNGGHSLMLAQASTMTYIGEGKHFLVVPNAFVSGGFIEYYPPNMPVYDALLWSDYRYNAALFIGDTTSTTYSRVAWPADDWLDGSVNGAWQITPGQTYTLAGAPWAGHPLLGEQIPYHTWTGALHPRVAAMSFRSCGKGHLSFGVGCFYMPVKYADGWRILSTRDFGESWTISGLVPTIIQPPQFINTGATVYAATEMVEGFVGTVIKPFVADAALGLILFCGQDDAAGLVRFYATNGLFDEFKPSGAVRAPAGKTLESRPDTAGYWFTYVGNQLDPQRRPFVHPGFPGEFDKPKA